MPPSLLAELDAFDKKKMDPEVNEWVKERGAVPAHRDDWSKIAIWLLKHDMQECFVHFMNAWGLDKLDSSHGVRQLAATIVRCPDLRELSLWSMEVTLLPEHIDPLVADAARQGKLTTLIEALASSGMLSVDDALVIAVQHTCREAIRALRSRITDVGMARIQSLAEYAVVADLFADQGPPTQ